MNGLTSSVQPSEILTLAQAIEFVFKKKFMDFYCLTIAKVVLVNDNNLTIQPMINFKLADGTSQIPPEISNVPFGIIAGGSSAIIVPYAKDDIVLVGFVDREFNALKQDNTTATTPALLRMHNIADAFVIMNWGNGKAPTTFITIDDSDNGKGITISSKKDVTIETTNNGNIIINSDGKTTVTAAQGNVEVTATSGDVTVTAQGNAKVTAPITTITSNTVRILPSSGVTALGGTFTINAASITSGTATVMPNPALAAVIVVAN